MTVQVSPVILTDEDREKFKNSVHGEKGWAARKEVQEFCHETLKQAFKNHGIDVKISWEDPKYQKKAEGADGG
jgi:hypothetical protein